MFNPPLPSFALVIIGLKWIKLCKRFTPPNPTGRICPTNLVLIGRPKIESYVLFVRGINTKRIIDLDARSKTTYENIHFPRSTQV